MKTKGFLILAGIVGAALLFAACPSNSGGSPGGGSPTGPTVTSVTVSAAGNVSIVTPGSSVQFSAVVHGENNPGQDVSWSFGTTGTPPDQQGTTLSNNGLLTVHADESPKQLTIRARSKVDTSKYGEATVTIMDATPTVSSVTVSPATISVGKGNAIQFAVTVTGINAYSHEVTWSMEGNDTGSETTLSEGLLTVGNNETAKTITVTATSTEDTTKFGTAIVTIPTVTPPLAGVVIIRGTPQVGSTLRADTSNLLGEGTISYSWERKDTADGTGTPIGTNATYTLVQDDLDKYISVTVTRPGNTGSKSDTTETAVEAAPIVTGDLQGNITVVNGINEENVNFTNSGVPSMSRANGSITFTLTGVFQSYRWFVDGIELTEAKGGSLKLYGTDYSVGNHRILVIVYRNSVPYSQEIQFTVN